MPAPVLSALSNTETIVRALFGANLTSPTGQPGMGWTVTVNGVTRTIQTATITGSNTVQLTMTGVMASGDLVQAAYNASTGNLVDAATGLSPVATITTTTSTNNSLHAALLAATTDLMAGENAVVSLVWNAPVTSSGGFGTGLTFTVNGVSTPFSSVAAGADPRILRVTFASNFQYNATIAFSYNAGLGDWTSGYPIASISNHPVVNGSKIGDPSSQYPLSSVLKELPVVKNGIVTAAVGLDLNMVDQKLLNEYGPATVDFGGTFGTAEVLILQRLIPLQTGMRVTQNFFVQNHPEQASDAATDWLTTVTQRIGNAIAALRSTDQAVVLSQQTIVQV